MTTHPLSTLLAAGCAVALAFAAANARAQEEEEREHRTRNAQRCPHELDAAVTPSCQRPNDPVELIEENAAKSCAAGNGLYA